MSYHWSIVEREVDKDGMFELAKTVCNLCDKMSNYTTLAGHHDTYYFPQTDSRYEIFYNDNATPERIVYVGDASKRITIHKIKEN